MHARNLVVRFVLALLIWSHISSVFAAPPTPPSGFLAGGQFARYFKNIIEGELGNGVCPAGQSIVGFKTEQTSLYGVPICQGTASNQWATNGSNISYSAGNVGIGTSSPAAKLDVQSTDPTASWVTTRFSGNNATGNHFIFQSNSPTGHVNIQARAEESIGKFVQLSLKGDGTEGTINGNVDRFIIDIPGNVGIGTYAPTEKLEVAGATKSQKHIVHDGQHYGFGDESTRIEGNSTSDYIAFLTDGGIERMRVVSGGNVGIGTNTPSQKLTVEGHATLRSQAPTLYLRDTDNLSGLIHMNSNLMYFLRGCANDSESYCQTGGQWPLVLDMNYNDAIVGNRMSAGYGEFRRQDTGVEGGEISLNGANQETDRYGRIIMDNFDQGLRIFRWRDNPGEYTEYAIFRPDMTYFGMQGNVGIGTTSPSAKLEVAGQIKITGGSPGVGKVLTSDASGLASWTTPASGVQLCQGIGLGNNTCYGVSALDEVTAGYNNTAIGFEALSGNSYGDHNTANGTNTLYWNTAGSYNTANGVYALYSNTTGNQNTANGVNALGFNITGNNNTANGVNALYSNETGYYNTANGSMALYYNTTGYYNTANGFGAGSNITTGSSNIAIGANAQVPSPTGSDQLSIGNWIYGVGGNIGIGTTSPGAKLDVNGTIKTLGSSIFAQSNNSDYAYWAAPIQLREAQYGGTSGHIPPRISFHWGGVVASQIGIESSGRIKIMNNPGTGYENFIANDIVAASNMYANNYYYNSDKNLKKDIVKIDSALDKIRKLNGYYFTWKASNTPSIGVIAQEIEKEFPQIIGENKDTNGTSNKTVQYGNLVAPLIESIKELADKSDAQEKEIQELKKQIAELKEIISHK